MASAWIKLEHTMPDKPEVICAADRLGIDQDAVVGKLIRVWIWADQQTVDGNAVRVTTAFIDRLTNCPGFAQALLEAGWLESNDTGLSLPNFTRHNGQTAKSRALTLDRVNRLRNGDIVTKALPEREGEEEREEEKDIQSRKARSARPIRRSPIDVFDLSGLDWERVTRFAEAAAKRVPPRSDRDRRAWIRYAVMAETTFTEHWLLDSAEAVSQAKETRGSRQAHFVAVLKSKAAEAGTDAETFNGIARRIEIPADIWQSDLLK